MRKISTAQVRNFSEQKLTIGLDLGDHSSCYCVLDETGHILVEQKVFTTPKGLRAMFGAMPHCRIAVETGMHSPWVSRRPTYELGPCHFIVSVLSTKHLSDHVRP